MLESVQCSEITEINKTYLNGQLGPRSKDNDTYEESDCHKTVSSKSVSSHDPLQLTDGKPIPSLQHFNDERVVE